MPFYAVAKGRAVGVYKTWKECEDQVKGFNGPKFRKFNTNDEAQSFIKVGKSTYSISTDPKKNKKKSPKEESLYEPYDQLLINSEGYLTKRDCQTYVVYTDGACSGNNKKKMGGGSGSGIWWGPGRAESIPNPSFDNNQNTNNFAEANAILFALRHAKEKEYQKIEVRTDSKFCIECLDKWIHSWISKAKNGEWKSGSGEPVIHQKVFEEIHNIRKTISVNFQHIKAHNGEVGNEKADELAVKAGKIHSQQLKDLTEGFSDDF